MVLDTVDGKLARCTGASSKWGNVFDHGIDLVHPPFWWWAWEHGLAAYGRPLEPVYATMVLWAIVGGYVAQRMIEGLFIKRFDGMEIHVWRPLDSKFRLITARRNPNMVILVAALLFGRPDVGLELVAVVDADQPDLPCGAAGADDRAPGARGDRSSPGSKRELYRDRARRVAAGARPVRRAVRHRPEGADPGRRRADGAAAGARAAGERRGRRGRRAGAGARPDRRVLPR